VRWLQEQGLQAQGFNTEYGKEDGNELSPVADPLGQDQLQPESDIENDLKQVATDTIEEGKATTAPSIST
jgi:hypothetical protein